MELEDEQENWGRVYQLVGQVLAFAPDNADAKSFQEAAKRVLSAQPEAPAEQNYELGQPTSFANGRYQVKRFLGKGVSVV